MRDQSAEYRKAQRHLARRDPILKRLIAGVGPCTLWHEPSRFAALVRSIISQQISTKAARAILALSDEGLRAAGLSANKARSLRDLSEKVHSGLVPLDEIHALEDEDVIARLVPVRGIGRWTAQMFLIFSLGRLDVLPVDDLGLRAGVRDVYALAELPDKASLIERGEAWRPYRSIATWYFWRSRGSVPQSGT